MRWVVDWWWTEGRRWNYLAGLSSSARQGEASWPLWAERLAVSVVADLPLLLFFLTRQVGDSFNVTLLTTISVLYLLESGDQE